MTTQPTPPVTPLTTPQLTPLQTATVSRRPSVERPEPSSSQNLNVDETLPTPAVSPTNSCLVHGDNDSELGGPRKRNQVKRACVNCQKACKKCDNGRPCGRCIKFGLEKTCADSARKERQRVGVKRGPYKPGRSDSVDSGNEDCGPVSGWTKLDILSRLCNTVLMHARELDENGNPDSEEPEVLAARSLEIIANRARGVDTESSGSSSSPDPLKYEYDHQSFDHRDLVQDVGGKGSGISSFGSYSSLYPYSSLTGSSLSYGPYGFGYGSLPKTKVREPNPLDDFAAISDTVRRMEDEANARSKKRKQNTNNNSSTSTLPSSSTAAFSTAPAIAASALAVTTTASSNLTSNITNNGTTTVGNPAPPRQVALPTVSYQPSVPTPYITPSTNNQPVSSLPQTFTVASSLPANYTVPASSLPQNFTISNATSTNSSLSYTTVPTYSFPTTSQSNILNYQFPNAAAAAGAFNPFSGVAALGGYPTISNFSVGQFAAIPLQNGSYPPVVSIVPPTPSKPNPNASLQASAPVTNGNMNVGVNGVNMLVNNVPNGNVPGTNLNGILNGNARVNGGGHLYSPPTPPEFCVPEGALLEPDAKRVRLDVI